MTRQLPRFCMYEVIERPNEIAEDFAKNGVTAEVIRRFLGHRDVDTITRCSIACLRVRAVSIFNIVYLVYRKTSKDRPLAEPEPYISGRVRSQGRRAK